MSQLGAATDVVGDEVNRAAVDTSVADELFAVVDLLEAQPSLRRAFSDPSSSALERARLSEKLFSGKVSDEALTTLGKVVSQEWPTAAALVEGVETTGVQIVLRAAQQAGNLEQVQTELHQFATLVDQDHDLSDALRNREVPLEMRRALVGTLVDGRVSAQSSQLLQRAAAGRRRNFPVTVQGYLDDAATIANEQIVEVVSAKALDDARVARLRRALEAHAGGPVALQLSVDPKVIGGLSIKMGDTVFESTVAGRLDDVRRQMNRK